MTDIDAEVTGETTDQLTPEDTGRWLLTTTTSRHVWDLDAMTYQRLPGDFGSAMPYDARIVPITRVQTWPQVGAQSLLFYDDPSHPSLVENFRLSATIERIDRLAADPTRSDPA